MRLDKFSDGGFDRGRPFLVEAAWRLIADLLVESWLPGSGWRRWVLRRFGAVIGRGVIIKPRVRIKFPWRLKIGDFSWIGESVWIDNLGSVEIGCHCCVSQGVYFCTGNHDWGRETFDLRVEPIVVEDGAWLGAFSRIGPGVTVGANAVAAIGSVVIQSMNSDSIWRGNPARRLTDRPVNAPATGRKTQ